MSRWRYVDLQWLNIVTLNCAFTDVSKTDDYSFFHTHRTAASGYYQSFFIHQPMHKWSVLKTILKFTLKLTLKQLQHISVQLHHHQGAHYSSFLKLQLLNNQIKYIGVVNSVVWLHMDMMVTTAKRVGAVLMSNVL
jgi:hypothetical protein